MKLLFVKSMALAAAAVLLLILGGSVLPPGIPAMPESGTNTSAESTTTVTGGETTTGGGTGQHPSENGQTSSPSSGGSTTESPSEQTESTSAGTVSTGSAAGSTVSPGSSSASSGKPGTSTSTKPDNTTTAKPPAASAGGSATKPTTGTPSPTPSVPKKTVVGYYTGWSAYQGYTPSKVPAQYLTHLNYAFAKIDPKTKQIALADPTQDRTNFAALRKLKKSNPHLKTLISVGGWDYSTYFSDVAASASSREAFAQSCVDFILEHGFDGVDLDWEYPVSGGAVGNSNRPQDKANFTLLLRAIRAKLDAQGKKDGRTYYLTIAGAANTSYLSKIEPQAVAGIVDYIFVMTYDMHGPWDQYADFNAPLYTPSESSPQYKNSVYDGIQAYLGKGVPASKLVLGMPFYGYLYQGVDSTNGGLYSRFSSAKAVTYDTVRGAYLSNSAYTKHRHATAQVPYLSGNGLFLSYEDPASIAAKAALAKSLNLAGAGAWSLAQDTSGALLKSAYQALM